MAQVQRKKMLWYYDEIINWMIANPGRPLYECAAHVGKSPNTLSIIINSDMFKAALAARKEQYRLQHDMGIIEKTTRVAHAGLDCILETLEKKRSAIPIETLQNVTGSALDRLGYSAKPQQQAPGISIHTGGGNAAVVLPVSQSDLEEARMALRQVQQSRVAPSDPFHSPAALPQEPEAESVTVIEEVAVASDISRD